MKIWEFRILWNVRYSSKIKIQGLQNGRNCNYVPSKIGKIDLLLGFTKWKLQISLPSDPLVNSGSHLLVIFSDGSNTILLNIDQTRTSFFEHRTNSNVSISLWSNSNTLFLASNKQTSNIKPNRAFTRFTKLLIEQTRTSNGLKRVHLLVIEQFYPPLNSSYALESWRSSIL